MHMNRIRIFCFVPVLMGFSAGAFAQTTNPQAPGFGYPTVEAAIRDLANRSDLQPTIEQNWRFFSDPSANRTTPASRGRIAGGVSLSGNRYPPLLATQAQHPVSDSGQTHPATLPHWAGARDLPVMGTVVAGSNGMFLMNGQVHDYIDLPTLPAESGRGLRGLRCRYIYGHSMLSRRNSAYSPRMRGHGG